MKKNSKLKKETIQHSDTELLIIFEEFSTFLNRVDDLNRAVSSEISELKNDFQVVIP